MEALAVVEELLLHAGVPVVLNRVVRAPRKEERDVRSLVSIQAVAEEENPLLVGAPLLLVDIWVQVVVPALAALLPDPIGQMLSDEGPLLRTVLLHQPNYQVVLLFGPGDLPKQQLALGLLAELALGLLAELRARELHLTLLVKYFVLLEQV